MIDIRDTRNMILASEDYKLIIRGDALYIVPSRIVSTLDVDSTSNQMDYASVLTLSLRGKLLKSRYTESGSRA